MRSSREPSAISFRYLNGTARRRLNIPRSVIAAPIHIQNFPGQNPRSWLRTRLPIYLQLLLPGEMEDHLLEISVVMISAKLIHKDSDRLTNIHVN